MDDSHIMERPRRWDLPFSRDLPNPEERRDMTEADLDRLMAIGPFSAMDHERFPRTAPLRGILKNDARIRRYRRGDVIVRQGDYGNSAFLILDGGVRVVLEGLDPVAVGRREGRRRSWVRSIARLLTNPASPEVRDASLYPQRSRPAGERVPGGPVHVQDVTNVLTNVPDAFERTIGTVMETGDLFGELAALGRIPRSATVLADGETELLEIRWQGLRDLRKYDAALRKHVDDQYRKFGLSAALRAMPLFATLSEEAAGQIARSAAFETYGTFDWFGSYREIRQKEAADRLSHEPLIGEEGHYPDGLILIRAGFARLSRKHGSGERTFGYLGTGQLYGLEELAHNAAGGPQVRLTASLRAVGYVDVVRIPTRAFEELILPRIAAGSLPPPPAAATGTDAEQGARPAAPPPWPGAPEEGSGAISADMMEFLVENRFINGTAAMIIDLDRCTRCDECVRACATGHDNNPRFVRHGKIMGHHMVANACMHCVDPVCMIGCPTGAIHRDPEGGEVVINDLTCIGCAACAESCPYDNIRMVEIRDRANEDAVMVDPEQGRPILKATKCDLCVDHHGGPACQRACPHDALVRVDMRDLKRLGAWLGRS